MINLVEKRGEEVRGPMPPSSSAPSSSTPNVRFSVVDHGPGNPRPATAKRVVRAVRTARSVVDAAPGRQRVLGLHLCRQLRGARRGSPRAGRRREGGGLHLLPDDPPRPARAEAMPVDFAEPRPRLRDSGSRAAVALRYRRLSPVRPSSPPPSKAAGAVIPRSPAPAQWRTTTPPLALGFAFRTRRHHPRHDPLVCRRGARRTERAADRRG